MSGSRNNHYVPIWHQSGFIEPNLDRYEYLDLSPRLHKLKDGQVKPERSRFTSYPSQCFVQRDLYSTFFGATVNDEIERKLFGAIDTTGAPAVKAFAGEDKNAWVQQFEALFAYIDIQKLRTPKGLDGLRTLYPDLTQNELMWEMQGLQTISCATWAEGVREIVSAEDSAVKFILTDHPVTVFNPGLPPRSRASGARLEPNIALKGSQTIFPLNRDFCLILTNLEYARDPTVDPLEVRTAPRNYRRSLTRTDAFIRSRKLSEAQVRQINMAMKVNSRRYVAAGQEAWLYPEAGTPPTWSEIATTLRPPDDELWHFGGEILTRFADGTVRFQDEFGRAEPEHLAHFTIEAASPKRGEACGCGSARAFRDCCEGVPKYLRPSWTQLSIRARNQALYRAAFKIFDLGGDRSWTDVRRDMTDEKIREFYEAFAAMWPLETDLLQLLPKPDGRPRAVYAGILHPDVVTEVATGAGLYFGEIIIEFPFTHPRIIRPEHGPLENPRAYRGEILKSLLFFLRLMPLVDAGLVSLIPDPGAFDAHLRETTLSMAQARYTGRDVKPEPDDRAMVLMEAAGRRTLLQLPERILAAQFRKQTPGLSDGDISRLMKEIARQRKEDPLAVLQPGGIPGGKKNGQLDAMTMGPNFEMAMFLAQATGACILTDARPRFRELVETLVRRDVAPQSGLPNLAIELARTSFELPQNAMEVAELSFMGAAAPYPRLFGDMTRYLQGLERRGRRPNFEKQLSARFKQAAATQAAMRKTGAVLAKARLRALLPEQGLRDNTVNRLLLMAGSEHHWRTVPSAFLLELEPQPA